MQINGANQFLAQAYGVGSAKPLGRAVLAKVGQAQATTPVEKADVKGRSPAVGGLVAAVVPGKVDFSGDTPMPGGASISSPGPGVGGTYQMYRRPTDKVEAATVVALGRRLDIQG